MNILFIGDVVGKPGRRVLKKYLSQIITMHNIDVVIVNAENAAHGKGLTRNLYLEIMNLGVNAVTLGNHAFAKRELLLHINDLKCLVRPANLEPLNFGYDYCLIETSLGKLAVFNICGQVFMNKVVASSFESLERLLSEVKADMYFVDFHGEATAEKLSFFYKYHEKLLAVVGTHTHIQTADERVYNGCAYISDVGMCGVFHSILGRDINEVLRLMNGEKTNYTIANGQACLNGVIIDVNNNCRVNSIRRINYFE